MDANGNAVMTPSAAYAGARLEVANDTTARGSTGMSFSRYFGLGSAALQTQASNMAVRSDIMQRPARLSLAQLDLSASSVPGDIVLGNSDNTGALALAAIGNALFNFDARGGISSSTMSLNDYVSQISGLQSDLATNAADESTNLANIQQEVTARKNNVEGVNLDEELSNMMIYQQAYNASARIMTVVQQMFDTLMQAV
jgi:flagellar hook-associated protein 1 FlgK